MMYHLHQSGLETGTVTHVGPFKLGCEGGSHSPNSGVSGHAEDVIDNQAYAWIGGHQIIRLLKSYLNQYISQTIQMVE